MYAHSAHIGLHTKECALMPSPWDDYQNMLAWLDYVEAKGNESNPDGWSEPGKGGEQEGGTH